MAGRSFFGATRSSVFLASVVTLVAPAWSAGAATATGFDGTYVGVSTPERVTPGCEEASRSIHIKIEGVRIWTRHHHPHMSGTITKEGDVLMQDKNGRQQIAGVIRGDLLTGTETLDEIPRQLRSFYANGQMQCRLSVSATRQ